MKTNRMGRLKISYRTRTNQYHSVYLWIPRSVQLGRLDYKYNKKNNSCWIQHTSPELILTTEIGQKNLTIIQSISCWWTFLDSEFFHSKTIISNIYNFELWLRLDIWQRIGIWPESKWLLWLLFLIDSSQNLKSIWTLFSVYGTLWYISEPSVRCRALCGTFSKQSIPLYSLKL